MKNQVIADLNFFPTVNGGRQKAIPPNIKFGCPVFFENIKELSAHAYDCRIAVDIYGKTIFPGDEVKGIILSFLSPEKVLPFIFPGATFNLWEMGIIAKGVVTSLEH